ncbi:MAG: hypothetical protein SFU86_10265 [Pirellulaceae bacterium]|nr:hypothetical protein [Pirellulaceae bacterium]
MASTTIDLFVFGNRHGPRPPRLGLDVLPDSQGWLPADTSSMPQGASSFADPVRSGLTGHYHRLPAGTELPTGLAVTADGCDVVPESPLPETHHTIHLESPMTAEQFLAAFLGLPWEYGGRL